MLGDDDDDDLGTKENAGLRRRRRELLLGAGDRIRTGDPELGKLVLYQLSYTRTEA